MNLGRIGIRCVSRRDTDAESGVGGKVKADRQGLWMYSGMAARMGQDLGLDPNVAQSGGDLAEGGDEMRRLYLLSSLYMLDACLTMGSTFSSALWDKIKTSLKL